MSSSHDCTYLRVGWGGVTTSPCTCSHLRCYALHVFFTCFHIASVGWGGGESKSTKSSMRLEFAREVRRQNGCKITVGTQTSDKCWDYLKDFIPNSVPKNAKNKLLHAEIWSHVYQWHWRYNHRHALRQMVPKVLKELQMRCCTCKWRR